MRSATRYKTTIVVENRNIVGRYFHPETGPRSIHEAIPLKAGHDSEEEAVAAAARNLRGAPVCSEAIIRIIQPRWGKGLEQ